MAAVHPGSSASVYLDVKLSVTRGKWGQINVRPLDLLRFPHSRVLDRVTPQVCTLLCVVVHLCLWHHILRVYLS